MAATATAPANGVKQGSSGAVAASGSTATGQAKPTKFYPMVDGRVFEKKIEVIGVTGDLGSGKTLFGLTIDPKRTLMFDAEKSGTTYESLGFERIDIADNMAKWLVEENARLRKEGKPTSPAYKPIDLFKWWLTKVRSIPAGKYSVIMVDPISEIENGLVQFVRDNPSDFGMTKAQIEGTLVWGVVKDFWKSILVDIATRCQTFVFTAHLKKEWSGNRPTGKQIPKGKETLMELASLYLWLDRPKVKGVQQEVPVAEVVKHRVSNTTVLEDGQIKIVSLLPPRLPVATPAAIRYYIANPPDYAKLKADEKIIEREVTDDERLEKKAQIAADEKETEALRLARLNAMQEAERKKAEHQAAREAAMRQQQAAQATSQQQQSVQQPTSAQPTKTAAQTQGQQQQDAKPAKPSGAVLTEINEHKKKLGIADGMWIQIIQKQNPNAKVLSDLTVEQADVLLGKLREKVAAKFGGNTSNPADNSANSVPFDADKSTPENAGNQTGK